MNAKERRLAKRAQERQEDAQGTKEMEVEQKPMNAKERRLAKRAETRVQEKTTEAEPESSPSGSEAPKLNAKERRLAKRAQERSGEQAGVDETTNEAEPAAKMNAKERRLAKRAQERSGEQAGVDETTNEAEPAAKMNAKERRLAKRAQERSGEQAGVDETTKPMNARERRLALRAEARNTDSSKPTETEEKTMNARERRLAKRAETRATENSHPDKPPKKNGLKRKRPQEGKGNNPYVLFVGQLPYTAAADDIKAHFESHDIKGGVKVRLRTDPKTGASKGMAFVEFCGPEEMHAGLALHRSYFKSTDGRKRQINVEKSAGGGKEKKKVRVQHARANQKEYMEQTFSRIMEEYREKGVFKGIELDDDIFSMLRRCEAKVVHAALEEFSAAKSDEVNNPSAFLTALVCRKLAEENPLSKIPDSKDQRSSGNRRGGRSDRSHTKRETDASKPPPTDAELSTIERRFPSLAKRGRRK